MEIKNIKTLDIKVYEFNNRIHTEIQIERIAKSIKEFGFVQPLVIDENNSILIGHGRLLAILDNKLQNDSTWNYESLAHEFDSLLVSDFPFKEWGLDELKLKIETNLNEMEFNESIATGVELCKCAVCGNEHAKK
jgi:hypothetical protein